MQLKSVDLPAPFGPIRPVIEPASTVERRTVDGAHAAEARAPRRRPRAATRSLEHHLVALCRECPCGRSTTSPMITRPITISRRYARSAESRYESGAKSRKRVPANRKPKTSAPTGTAQTRPSPPRITIIHAKNVSSGWKSSGLKNENCHA